MPILNLKRHDIVVLEGITGRVTFIDKSTCYVRLERGTWKATSFVNQLTRPTAEQVIEFENLPKK